jgi:hypothetical protein
MCRAAFCCSGFLIRFMPSGYNLLYAVTISGTQAETQLHAIADHSGSFALGVRLHITCSWCPNEARLRHDPCGDVAGPMKRDRSGTHLKEILKA